MPPPWPHGLPSCWPVAPIAADGAAGNRQRPVVEDAAALAATKIFAMISDVSIHAAVHQRQCRAAAIGGIVEDAAASIGTIAADNAVEDRQCRAAPEPSL